MRVQVLLVRYTVRKTLVMDQQHWVVSGALALHA